LTEGIGSKKTLQQVFAALFLEQFDHITGALRLVSIHDEQRVRGIHYHQILHAHQRDQFFASVDVIPGSGLGQQGGA